VRVLLIGGGAREHVIAERLAEDAELYAIMSKKNPAIASLAKKFWICDIHNPDEVIRCVANEEIDIAFASPDAVLAAGVSDALEQRGMLVASPTKAAARIEWDKGFARQLMAENKIPGLVNYSIVDNESDAARVIKDFGEVAIKPLGLTGGKGVKVSGDHFYDNDEALAYVKEVLAKDKSVLIEEKVEGEEFTLQVFSDGTRIAPMPPVQDHKRAFVGDTGKNTGGMGSYSTGDLLPFLTDKDIEEAKKILAHVVHTMKKIGTPFKGVLYGQFMATADCVKLIEYNARFGDPEAINVLSLFEGSLTNCFLSIAEGQLDPPQFKSKCTVVKYLVPNGYPDNPIPDAPVTIDEGMLEQSNAKLYYASVYEKEGRIYTTSSRSFAILGVAERLEDAERIAELGCRCVSGPVWHRPDIGTQQLVRKRIEHMQKIRTVKQ
jgi:phosphoribosylamine--glycine ligase